MKIDKNIIKELSDYLKEFNLTEIEITEKDKRDIAFGLKEDVDFIALSFVRNASDIDDLKELLKNKAKITIRILAITAADISIISK